MILSNTEELKRRVSSVLPFGFLALTFATMASISWYRWPEVLIDYGRELYVPWRISTGEMLYRDLPHLYGPLAHFVNAGLFTLFGTSLRTLVSFNLLLIAALSLGIYGIFRRACDRLTATLCGMVFLGVFAFSRNAGMGNWNFVCPYSHEVTYGICISFLLIPALERYSERGSRLWAGVVGFLLGVIFLAKVEVFAAAFLTTVVVVSLPAIRTRSLSAVVPRNTVAAATGFAIPLLFFLALFSSRTTVAEAASMVATTVTSLGRPAIVMHPFYLGLSGLDAPVANIVMMLKVAAVYGVLLTGVVLLSKIMAGRGGAGRNIILLSAIVLALVAFAWLFKDRTGLWTQSGRAFALFVLVYVCQLIWRSGRGDAGDAGRKIIPLLAFSVFSFFLLGKILLRVEFRHYGFALAMPATLVVVAIVVHHIPELVRRRGGCAVTAKVVATTLVVLFLALQAEMSRNVYSLMSFPVGHGADRFYTFGVSSGAKRLYMFGIDAGEVGPVVKEALEAIETTVPMDAGFVVLPEGVMLNYLTRRPNPGRWFEFTPQYIANIGEKQMISDLAAARPEYVVLTERPTPEHGARYFGTDYGLGLKAWIMDNYSPVHLAGRKVFSNQGFGIAIAKRNGGPR